MNDLELKVTRNSLYFWNIIATAIFIVLLVKVDILAGDRFMRVFADIPPYHFIIIAFAIFRITRLLVADHITQWLRDLCMKTVTVKDALTGAVFVRCEKPIRGIRRLISDLLGCPWCVGVWVSFATLILYYLAAVESFSLGWIIILIFAFAGAGELVYAVVVALLSPHTIVSNLPLSTACNLLGDQQRRPLPAMEPAPAPHVCINCGAESSGEQK